MAGKIDKLPKAFIWRRLHSLAGLWLVIFLMEHLLTNSQAALLLGDSGKGFIRMVNGLHNLPYLTVIEISLLGIPIALHMIWGVKYALTSKPNSMSGQKKKPHLKYSRNRAYTWQRITSWILLVLLILHIVKFRFLEYPDSVNSGSLRPSYLVTAMMDPGLYTVADRLGVKLYDEKTIQAFANDQKAMRETSALSEAADKIRASAESRYDSQTALVLQSAQARMEEKKLKEALASYKLKPGQVVADSPTFGTATLVSVRDTFKNPWWVAVYTVFVLSAGFHAFNGLWTSAITWGWVIKATAQTAVRRFSYGLMVIVTLLGLIAIWGTYFWNLKH